MAFMANDVYGGQGPAPQPNNTPAPNPPGQGEPFARTTGGFGVARINPTLVLVGLLGLAIGLIHLSVRIDL